MPPVVPQLQQEKSETNAGHDCESCMADQKMYRQTTR